MTDTQIIDFIRQIKVAHKEWTPEHRPTVRELSKELRAMNRLDVAARVESGETVFALRN